MSSLLPSLARRAFGCALSLLRDRMRMLREAPPLPGAPDFPGLEQGLAVYCIGDLHGRTDCLLAAHDLIDADCRTQNHVRVVEVYLGDYVDRGPDSAGVIDALLARAQQASCRFLRGNHERALCDFLDGRMPLESWRAIGGYETIMSYGVDPRTLARSGKDAPAVLARNMPQAHHAFLGSLVNAMTIGPYFFAHAGVRPGIPLEAQAEKDLLWIRDKFLASTEDFGAVVVHGHTPAPEPQLLFNRINLDTGAYATGHLGIARIDSSASRLFAPPSTRPRAGFRAP